MSEGVEDKADRLVREGRVHLIPSETYAVEGDHGVYMTTLLSNIGQWTCTCLAVVNCSHIEAAKGVHTEHPTKEIEMTRDERFEELIKRFAPPAHLVFDREVDTLGRYALVELSTYDAEYVLTSYESMKDASEGHAGQECPEDWPAVELVDLDTGQRYYCVPELSFEPYPDGS